MKKLITIIMIAALFLTMTIIPVSADAQPSLDRVYVIDEILWGEQDNNGYFFMYLDKSDKQFKELTFDSITNSFWGPAYENAEDYPGLEYLMIIHMAAVIHPANEADIVVGFKCDFTGTIKGKMNIRAGAPTDGDPTAFTVYKNNADTIVFPAEGGYVLTENPGADYEFSVDVIAGDMLYLSINIYETINNDSTAFDFGPQFQYTVIEGYNPETGESSSDDKPSSEVPASSDLPIVTDTKAVSETKAVTDKPETTAEEKDPSALPWIIIGAVIAAAAAAAVTIIVKKRAAK